MSTIQHLQIVYTYTHFAFHSARFWITIKKYFIIGFGIGLFIFLGINLLSAHLTSDCCLLAVFERDACADDIVRAGWPLAFYERGGFDYRFSFDLLVLSVDLAIGIIWAGGLGWLMTRKQTEIQS